MSEIASPCVLICSIDEKTGYCFGCGRTRDEVAGWMDYSHDERLRIMEGLGERLAVIERKPRRITRRARMRREREERERMKMLAPGPLATGPQEPKAIPPQEPKATPTQEAEARREPQTESAAERVGEKDSTCE